MRAAGLGGLAFCPSDARVLVSCRHDAALLQPNEAACLLACLRSWSGPLSGSHRPSAAHSSQHALASTRRRGGRSRWRSHRAAALVGQHQQQQQQRLQRGGTSRATACCHPPSSPRGLGFAGGAHRVHRLFRLHGGLDKCSTLLTCTPPHARACTFSIHHGTLRVVSHAGTTPRPVPAPPCPPPCTHPPPAQAPEVLRSQPYDASCDIFSLGMCM